MRTPPWNKLLICSLNKLQRVLELTCSIQKHRAHPDYLGIPKQGTWSLGSKPATFCMCHLIFFYPFLQYTALKQGFHLTDGAARILPQFLSFYLPHDKYPYWSAWHQALCEKECLRRGTREDRSITNLWSYLGSNPGECFINWAMPLGLPNLLNTVWLVW